MNGLNMTPVISSENPGLIAPEVNCADSVALKFSST